MSDATNRTDVDESRERMSIRFIKHYDITTDLRPSRLPWQYNGEWVVFPDWRHAHRNELRPDVGDL